MAPKKSKTQQPFTPNPEQAAAINAGQGIWGVVAGAGSGKTSVLVARYQKLLAEGVPPDEILGLTFTSSGAKNMRDRAGVQKTDGRVNGFVTFHSLCLSIVTAERSHFPFELQDFPLATEGQAGMILSGVAKKYELDFKRVRNWISLQKRGGVRPKEALLAAEKESKDEKLALAYKAFNAKLREAKVLDFDSMMQESVDLLRSNPSVLARWQFKYLMVDEAQDCSPQDYDLIALLAQNYGNVFFVGDGGQGVFGFRGAQSEMFMSIPDPSKVLYMGKNHRSTGAIVSFLKEIGPIPALADRFHTDNEFGVAPVVVGYPSGVDEAKAVASACSKATKNITICVIARTNRALRQFEDTFSAEGVKYYLASKSGFWQQSEVKSCLAYLQCCIFPSDAAVMTALRSPFHPGRYIKKSDLLPKIKNKPEDQNVIQFLNRQPGEQIRDFVHFLDGLRRYRDMPPDRAVKSVLSALHAMEYFKEEESSPDNSPVENLQELVRASQRFSSVKEFLDFTRRASAASKTRKGVCLSTCHASKGLEYDIVYFVQLNEGVLPHSKAESLEEESRVFFVGASRARHMLAMSYAGPPSQFLAPYLKKNVVDDEVFV